MEIIWGEVHYAQVMHNDDGVKKINKIKSGVEMVGRSSLSITISLGCHTYSLELLSDSSFHPIRYSILSHFSCSSNC